MFALFRFEILTTSPSGQWVDRVVYVLVDINSGNVRACFIVTWLVWPLPFHSIPSRATWWRVCALTVASWLRPTLALLSIKISCTTTTGTTSSWTRDTRYAILTLRSPSPARRWVVVLHCGDSTEKFDHNLLFIMTDIPFRLSCNF